MHILKYLLLVVKNFVLPQYLYLETGHECLSVLSLLIFLLFHYCYYWASQVVLGENNLPANPRRHKRCGFNPWVGSIPWWRAWQPTPVFLPGESHGQRSLAGYSTWGHKELDITEVT